MTTFTAAGKADVGPYRNDWGQIVLNENLSFIVDDYQGGLTLVFGGSSSGKTTVINNAVSKLFNSGVINSYAYFEAHAPSIVNGVTVDDFFDENDLTSLIERKPIFVKLYNDIVIEAKTDADVIIIPELRNEYSAIILDVALKTGKPVFAEIHATGFKEALNRLELIELTHKADSDSSAHDYLSRYADYDDEFLKIEESSEKSYDSISKIEEVVGYANCIVTSSEINGERWIIRSTEWGMKD